MKVILLQDVKSLGKKGAMVEVSEGYARNFIIPKKLGLEATPKNLNDLKLQKANEEKVAKEHLEAAQAFAKEMENDHVIDRTGEVVSNGEDKSRRGRKIIWIGVHKGDFRCHKEPARQGYRQEEDCYEGFDKGDRKLHSKG